jgi:hypothetical protein
MAGPDIQDGRQQRPKWGRLLPVVLKGVKWDISDISGRASKRHFAPGADIRVGREDASLNGRDWAVPDWRLAREGTAKWDIFATAS